MTAENDRTLSCVGFASPWYFNQCDCDRLTVKFFRLMDGLNTGTLKAMQTDSNLLAEILGPAALSRLAAVHGGCDFLVPGAITTGPGKALVELVGAEAAERLIAWGRSSRCYVPKLRIDIRQQRAAEIRALHRQGLTAAQISRSYTFAARYSERAVFKILSEGKKA